MAGFRYNTQTACFCGEGCVKEQGAFIAGHGNKCAVITSRFAPGCRNYALEDVCAVLEEKKIEYIVIDRVQENPPVESIVDIADECMSFGTEFIIAIGGGSAIDSAKAAALRMKHPTEDPYKVFYGYDGPSESIRSEADIPLFAIPTTAGTGAEVTGFAVLTRSDTDTKLSIYPVVFCEAAFLDPRYIRESPLFLLHSGAMDTLAHGIETYLHNSSNIINRSVAEIGFRLFAGYKDALLEGRLSNEDMQNMQIASFMMGMAFMQSSTTIPHGMGYPLSHYKRVNHGFACAVFLGEYLCAFKDRTQVNHIVNACGFDSAEDFASYIRSLVSKSMKIEVSTQELDKWTDDFMKLDFRLASNPEKLEREDIYGIYKRSLAPWTI